MDFVNLTCSLVHQIDNAGLVRLKTIPHLDCFFRRLWNARMFLLQKRPVCTQACAVSVYYYCMPSNTSFITKVMIHQGFHNHIVRAYSHFAIAETKRLVDTVVATNSNVGRRKIQMEVAKELVTRNEKCEKLEMSHQQLVELLREMQPLVQANRYVREVVFKLSC
ncbi:hypothetical protein O6H91_19G033900 [Diphasiastrum complanatum]|uniref:Uncharacterized protein n=1 Tax=Diphasiastrum complanatum TaxID=34168 RepID=A0ACC2AU20_DIPCM|nr:hypothetical protein O6H91_19G033900 [Diphasiastrum complanatum]